MARGRWKAILIGMGVSPELVSGKHGPCPWCGGRDRFRFTDFEEKGLYICNQCGGGDGFKLAHKVLGLSYSKVCKEVEGLVGKVEIAPPPKRRSDVRLKAEWASAKKIQVGSPVVGYLKGRGLESGSRHLRFLERALGENVGAMMAEITDEYGKLLGYHYTYLWKRNGRWEKAEVDPPKRTRKTGTTISGGSIKLYGIERGLIGLTEGIETALAVRHLFGTPTWACMSTAGLVKVRLPKEVERVLIYADNDRNFAGQKAAYELANRLRVKDGFEGGVEVRICSVLGGDYLDALVQNTYGKITRRGV